MAHMQGAERLLSTLGVLVSPMKWDGFVSTCSEIYYVSIGSTMGKNHIIDPNLLLTEFWNYG